MFLELLGHSGWIQVSWLLYMQCLHQSGGMAKMLLLFMYLWQEKLVCYMQCLHQSGGNDKNLQCKLWTTVQTTVAIRNKEVGLTGCTRVGGNEWPKKRCILFVRGDNDVGASLIRHNIQRCQLLFMLWAYNIHSIGWAKLGTKQGICNLGYRG